MVSGGIGERRRRGREEQLRSIPPYRAASRNAHGRVIGGASGYPGNTMISVLATLSIFF
jgi:hypothetical protein